MTLFFSLYSLRVELIPGCKIPGDHTQYATLTTCKKNQLNDICLFSSLVSTVKVIKSEENLRIVGIWDHHKESRVLRKKAFVCFVEGHFWHLC